VCKACAVRVRARYGMPADASSVASFFWCPAVRSAGTHWQEDTERCGDANPASSVLRIRPAPRVPWSPRTRFRYATWNRRRGRVSLASRQLRRWTDSIEARCHRDFADAPATLRRLEHHPMFRGCVRVRKDRFAVLAHPGRWSVRTTRPAAARQPTAPPFASDREQAAPWADAPSFSWAHAPSAREQRHPLRRDNRAPPSTTE